MIKNISFITLILSTSIILVFCLGCLFPSPNTVNFHKNAIKQKSIALASSSKNQLIQTIRLSKKITSMPSSQKQKAQIIELELAKLLKDKKLDPHISYNLEKTLLKSSSSRSSFIYNFYLQDLPVLDSGIKAHFLQNTTLLINGSITTATYNNRLFSQKWTKEFNPELFKQDLFDVVFDYMPDHYENPSSAENHDISFVYNNACVASDRDHMLRKSHCITMIIDDFPFIVAIAQPTENSIEIIKVKANFFIN